MAESDLQAHYALDQERDRLSAGTGRVEYLRTVEVISRTLPAPPAVVADIGGGPGRYTDWLVDAGYTVIHRDLVAHHVDQVKARHQDRVDAEVGDAREMDLADNSVDAVLLLGPLYHLEDPTDRMTVLDDTSFNGYAHTPGQLRDELDRSGLVVESLVALEGISFALADLDARLDDDDERKLLLDSLRAVESIPDLLGLGTHLFATGREP